METAKLKAIIVRRILRKINNNNNNNNNNIPIFSFTYQGSDFT